MLRTYTEMCVVSRNQAYGANPTVCGRKPTANLPICGPQIQNLLPVLSITNRQEPDRQSIRLLLQNDRRGLKLTSLVAHPNAGRDSSRKSIIEKQDSWCSAFQGRNLWLECGATAYTQVRCCLRRHYLASSMRSGTSWYLS